MAKVRTAWELVGTVLRAVREQVASEFDLARVFPNFDDLTPIQKDVVAYGMKQKLGDSTARNEDEKLTASDASKVMLLTYEDVVSGAWSKRGTGVKVTAVKTLASVKDILASTLTDSEKTAAIKALLG